MASGIKMGGMMEAPIVRIGRQPARLSVILHLLPSLCIIKSRMMESNWKNGYHPVGAYPMGAPTCLRKTGGGETQPERSTMLCWGRALCLSWSQQRNVDSLTSRVGELVETLADRKIDVSCVQETRCRGSECRLFGTISKKVQAVWMGSKVRTDGVGMSVAEKWVDSIVSDRVLVMKMVLGDCSLNVLTVYTPHSGK